MDFPPPEALSDTLQPTAAAPRFLAQGSSVTSSLLSLCGIPSWKCSPPRCSAPVPWQTRCWGQWGLPGLPWGQQSLAGAACSLSGPWVSLPGVSLPDVSLPGVSLPAVPSAGTVAPSQLSGAVRHCLRHSGLSGSTSERVSGTFTLFKQTCSVLGFLGLLLIPGSAAPLLSWYQSSGRQEGCLCLIAPIL